MCCALTPLTVYCVTAPGHTSRQQQQQADLHNRLSPPTNHQQQQVWQQRQWQRQRAALTTCRALHLPPGWRGQQQQQHAAASQAAGPKAAAPATAGGVSHTITWLFLLCEEASQGSACRGWCCRQQQSCGRRGTQEVLAVTKMMHSIGCGLCDLGAAAVRETWGVGRRVASVLWLVWGVGGLELCWVCRLCLKGI